MKIIRIIARLNIGGPAIHISNLCDLQKYGHEMILIYGATSPGEGDMSYLLKDKKVKNYFIPELGREISPLKDIKTFFKVYNIIRKEKPDVVHTHTAKAGFVGRAAAALAGVKKIYHTFHGHVFHGYFSPSKTYFFVVIERFLALFSKKILVLNEQQHKEISGILKINENKFRIIPLGFDLSKFTEVYHKQSENKQSCSKAKCINIGIVGRLTGVKNHKLFVDILSILGKKDYIFKARIAGDGELRDAIAKQVEQAGLTSRVEFSGWVKELAPVYENMDFLFLTSINEGTPVAIIEAMASGTIVISTPAGGVVTLVNNGINGFYADDFTAEAFVRCFERVCALTERQLAEVRTNAFETAAKFSLATLLQNIDNLYNE